MLVLIGGSFFVVRRADGNLDSCETIKNKYFNQISKGIFRRSTMDLCTIFFDSTLIAYGELRV